MAVQDCSHTHTHTHPLVVLLIAFCFAVFFLSLFAFNRDNRPFFVRLECISFQPATHHTNATLPPSLSLSLSSLVQDTRPRAGGRRATSSWRRCHTPLSPTSSYRAAAAALATWTGGGKSERIYRVSVGVCVWCQQPAGHCDRTSTGGHARLGVTSHATPNITATRKSVLHN